MLRTHRVLTGTAARLSTMSEDEDRRMFEPESWEERYAGEAKV